MKISCKHIDKYIDMLLIKEFSLDTNSNINFITILKKLTIGESYYCEFSRENFFLNEDEAIKYRSEIPNYLDENGVYIVKEKRDEECFKSICKLTLNENTYKYMPSIWKYFENVMFFTPTSQLSWQAYEKIYNKIKPELYGIGLIQKKYANSVFLKDHDGDNLIFAYGYDYPRSLLQETIKEIKDL